MNDLSSLAPVAPSQRILSLDILRGFAVLGILIMNIQSFSMIEAAYINPTAFGDLTGINKWVWMLSHVFADQKFMTIFSILFGAGIVLFTEKAEIKGKNAAELHYRRTFWLLLIGMVHAYVFWHGDILVTYALCSIIAFLFRKKRPTTLLIFGLLTVSGASLIYLFFGWTVKFWPPEAIQNSMASWKPGVEMIQRELTALRGGLISQMLNHRIASSIKFQTFIFLIWNGWRAGGLMLIGMALYKWGVLSAQRSRIFYLQLLVIGYAIGLTTVIYGMVQNFRADWSLEFSMFLGWQFNYWGSIFVSLGHISLVILFYRMLNFKGISERLAAVGRLALSNYLAQTLICTTIF